MAGLQTNKFGTLFSQSSKKRNCEPTEIEEAAALALLMLSQDNRSWHTGPTTRAAAELIEDVLNPASIAVTTTTRSSSPPRGHHHSAHCQSKRNMEGDIQNMKKWVVFYPIYINSKKTIAEGGRINISKACENPTYAEIYDCCSHLKLPCAIENKMLGNMQKK
ncbi:unnamed protein product [Fraxinus pennsylvanica]|uniref:Signal recognition particle 19 kDa protein n=1 Tax=Fraxinus pennsylvanica TaxID=56036 RepID=A0AAD1Z4I2_9LAMI|nr:unnamed protein product [Fraxinus pennsylvanica]